MTYQPMDVAATCGWLDEPFMGICPEAGVRPMNDFDDEPNLVAYSGYSVVSNCDLPRIDGFREKLDRLPFSCVSGCKTRDDAENRKVELQMNMGGDEGAKEAGTAWSEVMDLVQQARPEISVLSGVLSGCGSYAAEKNPSIMRFPPRPRFLDPQSLTSVSPSTSSMQGPDDGREQQSPSSLKSAKPPSRHFRNAKDNRFSPAALADYAARQTNTASEKRRAPDDSDEMSTTFKRQARCEQDGITGGTSFCGQVFCEQDTEMGESA
jgi:hypothetical protein